MQLQIADEVLKHVDIIGAKLGQLGQNGFDVMVQQIRVEAYADLVSAGIYAMLMVASLATAVHFFRKGADFKALQYKAADVIDYRTERIAGEHAFASFFATVVASLLTSVFSIAMLADAFSGAKMLANSQYYAIEKIAQMVKP